MCYKKSAKKIPGILFLLLSLIPEFSVSQTLNYEEAVKRYIERYSDAAIHEMMIYRIPASITLAQGIFESNAGRSRLATEANNHFGIKCHKDWTGPALYQDDDVKNECFRKYDKPEESFRDHSCFLTTRDRYRNLFSLAITDYKSWAKGLKEDGYATNPQYAEKLINTIERFQLYRFDQGEVPLAEADTTTISYDSIKINPLTHKPYEVFAYGPGERRVYVNNDLQFLILRSSDNIDSISKAFHVSKRRILRWNDLKKGSLLAKGQMVYLEHKKRRGATDVHVVRRGETLYTISQENGINLKMLYKRNHLKEGQKIRAGQRLLLR
ncbi:MAG: glucosaminidase domain-containing protein [Bacteroidota bacterium]|nr:glucosaminidase domain-containing protein [Bacteroidota bacterium]